MVPGSAGAGTALHTYLKGHSLLGDPKLKMVAGHSSSSEVILLFSPQPALVPYSAASLMH